MTAKAILTIGFLVTSTYGGVWAVHHPEQWMNENQIKAYRNFIDAQDLKTITINGKDYQIENGELDLLKLYDMARAEADRILASGDVDPYRNQLREYNAFFRMIGADEIPLND